MTRPRGKAASLKIGHLPVGEWEVVRFYPWPKGKLTMLLAPIRIADKKAFPAWWARWATLSEASFDVSVVPGMRIRV